MLTSVGSRIERRSTPSTPETDEKRTPARVAQLHRIGNVTATLAVAIGATAMVGWILGIDTLKSVVPGLITMKANTALVFIILGSGLYLLRGRRDHRPSFAIPVGIAAAAMAFVVSALVFSQFLHGVNLGVDEFLFDEPDGTVGTVYPGRMALNTSVCFMLAAAGTLLIKTRLGPSLSPVLGMLVSGAGLLALVGYATGVTNLYGIANATQMAVPTATGFVLLGAGLITARPDAGPVRLMASEGPGGSLVRGVLPLAVGGIVLLAVLRLAGQAAGLYETQVGTWLLVSGVIALLVPLVWRVAGSLDEADAERVAFARDNEAILNSAGSGIVRVDNDGRATFVNPAAAQMLGWPGEGLLGRDMYSVSHHGYGDRTGCCAEDWAISATFSDGQVHHRDDEVFLRQDGSSFDVEYTSAPVRENGRVVGATVVFSDISERRSTERELADKRTALERSNSALEEFAAVAAHDLNSPMSTVAGFTELLEARYAEEIGVEGRDYLRRISRSVARSQALIGDLLAFTRADRVEIEPQAVDMDAVVEDVLSALGRAIEEKGTTIDVDGLPRVLGDANQLHQLIQNLISNAIKFSDAGLPVVEIAAEARGGMWSFSVSDNGLGVPPAQRREVFTAFKRVHGQDIEGTGIGLAICQRIVERHGGEIYVEAGIDGGSRFVFTLPGVGVEGMARAERVRITAGAA